MNPTQTWLTLTDLGRLFGISAVFCGKLLGEAGLRDPDGMPNSAALDGGFAFRRPEQNANRSILWNQQRCSELLLERGLQPMDEQQLIQQWADLLAALEEGSPSINTSPAQMAEELPVHLVPAVNQRLQLLGSSFQVSGCQAVAATSGK
jgi:hypothetical protein